MLASDEMLSEAASRALPWGAVDDELAWREALRAHVAADGAVLRRTLVDRALRWQGVASDDEASDRVNAWIDDLDAVGDLLVGARGLVGAAPVRAARVRGTSTVMLLGSVSTAMLRRALPREVIEDRRVRRASLAWHDPEALSLAMRAIGATVTDADAWAGLDRAPATLDAWWTALATLGPRDAEVDPGFDGPSAQAYAVRDGRGRWRSRADAEAPWLVRVRQPGGWFRFAWDRGDARVALTTDGATRALLALEGRAGAARTVAAARGATGAVEFALPVRVPRAEYRMLLGTSDRAVGDDGARFATPMGVWPTVAAMLRERLGLIVDETGVTR